MKRLALVGAFALLLAACGGGGGNPDAAKVTQVFTSFFSSKTPVSEKPAMIQNGSKFKAEIQTIASNPLAKDTSAKVSTVTVHGARATVVFSVYLGSVAVLDKTTGYALKQHGSWVIADSSLCKLLALESGGSTPAACAS